MYGIIRKDSKMYKNNNMTSKDRDGNILVNGELRYVTFLLNVADQDVMSYAQ